MKLLKVLTALIAVGAATTAVAQPYTASQEQQRLISLGMSPELSKEVTNFIDGDGIYQGILPTYVPTMAATPVAGINVFQPGANLVPTAAANTAALLPANPVPGQSFEIINRSPNAVRIKAGGTTAINGGSAGNYISLATLQHAVCVATTSSRMNCGLLAVPTPAGP